jgi:hypothetical protein
MVVRISELTDAREIRRRELRDSRIFWRWLVSQPRHQAELAWLRFLTRHDRKT